MSLRYGMSPNRAVPSITAVLCSIAVAIGCCSPMPFAEAANLPTSEFGTVDLRGPVGSAKGFAIVFSGDQGFSEDEQRAISTLLQAGLAIAAIDSRKALLGLEQADPEKDCAELPGPLEWVSQQAQHTFRFARYEKPVLLGTESGASLVYWALVQAPPLAFASGLSVDFSPHITLRRPLCGLNTGRNNGQQTFSPNQPPHEPWRIAGSRAITEEASAFAAAVLKMTKASQNYTPQTGSVSDLYLSAVQSTLRQSGGLNDSATVADLPLVEVSSISTSATLAIIYSGDGGWRDIDRTLGDLLKDRGLAVVGVDALRYFWSERTPEATSKDLDRIIMHYLRTWRMERILLIGYSFGADILPFAYNRLTENTKRSVVMLSLIAPGPAADFEIQIFGWFGGEPSERALPISPEITSIDTSKVQCIYGVEEEDSLCTTDTMRGAENLARRGGHHFGQQYAPIADLILNGLARRSAQR